MASPFYKVEAGEETAGAGTRGTAVAATTKLASLGFRPAMGYLNLIQPEEERGSLAQYHRSYIASKLVEGTLEGEATFEEIIIPLCMNIEDIDGSAASTITSSTYDWDFEPNWTSANNPGTWTMEWGDDVQAWEAEYVFGTGLTISGATEESWMISSDVAGRKLTTASFSGSSVVSDLENILFQESKLYIDDESSTIGTTQITGSFLDFEWSLGQHYTYRFTGDGELYFNSHKECKHAPELTLTLVLDATTKTQLTTKYENETQQVVRIAADGGTTGDGGYSKYCYIDGCYKITDVSELGDSDCDTIVSLTMTGEYGSTYGKMYNIQVRNKLQYPPGESS